MRDGISKRAIQAATRVTKHYGIPISYRAELQYAECRKVTRRLFLVGSQSSARIQFHGTAGNLLCRTQLGELRFAVGASWSNFAEKISEELIIRLSTLNRAFPMFLLLGYGLQRSPRFIFRALPRQIIVPENLASHTSITWNSLWLFLFPFSYFFTLELWPPSGECVDDFLKSDIRPMILSVKRISENTHKPCKFR